MPWPEAFYKPTGAVSIKNTHFYEQLFIILSGSLMHSIQAAV